MDDMHRRHHLNRRAFLRTSGAAAASTISSMAIAQGSGGDKVRPLVSGRVKPGLLES